MKVDIATPTKFTVRKYKAKKKRRILFQVCDRDALSHIYSYLTRIEFATVILVSRHWNRIGSMRSCWPPYTRETILHRYVNSIVGAGEYDDSVLHPRRLEPKGIFDLQRLIRTGGTYSQVNDLAFDEEYYANPSPLIELTKLKNLTSLRYTLIDCAHLDHLLPFAEVMSHRLLVLKLIINRETHEDHKESNKYSKTYMKRHEKWFAPIGLLVQLRMLVTNTLPPDSILVKKNLSVTQLQPPRVPHPSNQYPWYIDPIPENDVNVDLPVAQLTSFWLGENRVDRENRLDLSVNDFISLFSMPNLRHLRCQVQSMRPLCSSILAYDANPSIAVEQLESLDLELDVPDHDLTALERFTGLRQLRLSFLHVYLQNVPIDLGQAFPHFLQLKELSLTVGEDLDLASTTWSSLHHLLQLRRLNFRRSTCHRKQYHQLFQEIVSNFSQVPQLEEVHWYQRLHIWHREERDFLMFPPQIVNAINTSSSWTRFHFHIILMVVDIYHNQHCAGRTGIPDDEISFRNSRLPLFRLYIDDIKGRGKVPSYQTFGR